MSMMGRRSISISIAFVGLVFAFPASADNASASTAVADAWTKLGATTNTCVDGEIDFDPWPDGGMRTFWCHARSVMPWAVFAKLVPVEPWVSGPHRRWREGALSLKEANDFGRYNPKFVRWLVDNAVPASTRPALREQTQPVYDKLVARLARTTFAVWRKLSANPAFKKRERALYAQAIAGKNAEYMYYDRYGGFLGKHGLTATRLQDFQEDWGGHDINVQSAAVAFWLRRDMDGTAAIFAEGLQKLLKTYDANWLATQQR